MSELHKIAVFASGYGSNFEAIADACASGEIPAEVVLVVCDKPGARVCEVARERGIEVFSFYSKDYAQKSDYEALISARCKALGVELICLAGYMRIIGERLLEDFGGRIINIHPSLLPAFKGAHAIEQALEYGVKVFGVSIHYVDESLDGGRIIAQQAFPYEGSDLEEVTALTHAIEHKLYVKTIKKLLCEHSLA